MTIGPADFITQPFERCPRCGEREFGLLGVQRDNFSKRCRKCMHEHTYPLPPLTKRIIYLDQLAISNLMLVMNPETRRSPDQPIEPFWNTAFEKLDALLKLQVIVCPDTEIHSQESLVHRHARGLEKVYEHFSLGVSFEDTWTIERFQIQVHARSWLAGQPGDEPILDRQHILHGDLDGWADTIILTATGQATQQEIDALRAAREELHEGFKPIFERWRTETSLSLEDRFQKEMRASGPAKWDQYADHVRRLAEIKAGLRLPTPDDVPPFRSGVVMVHQMHEDFQAQGGLGFDAAWAKVREYLWSPSLEVVPSIRISCWLWAAIAGKAAAGMKKPPNQGTFNDIRVISTVLPYCDAVFIDRDMHNYLRELGSRLNYRARVFSAQSRDDFLRYLDEIAREVPDAHIDLVDRVYGRGWAEQFRRAFGR
jgi:hypothetical protein